MSNHYTPGWQISFPEPNGDRYVSPNTGARREPPAVCYTCGSDLDEQPVRFEGHEFCGRECLDTWVRR